MNNLLPRVWALALGVSLGFSAHVAGGEVGRVNASVRVGDEAPEITIDDVIQGPAIEQLTWSTLRGRVVILDFWATWCGPCVASIPHLNILSRSYPSDRVVFLSVSDEERGHVTRFLSRKPINSWVALDADQTMFIEYGATQLPLTVIVDPSGHIARLTRPDELRPWMIDEVLRRSANDPTPPLPIATPRPEPLPTPEAAPRPATQEPESPLPPPAPAPAPTPNPPPLQSVPAQEPWTGPRTLRVELSKSGVSAPGFFSLSASSGGESAMEYSGDLFVARNASLVSVLSVLHGVEYGKIEGAQFLPAGLHTLRISAPQGQANLELLGESLRSRFGVLLHVEERETSVLELRRIRPWMLGPSRAIESRLSQGPGRITAKLADLKLLSVAIGEAIGQQVVDKTDVNGRFDLEFNWNQDDPDSILASLAQVGLGLFSGQGRLRYLVIEKQ